MLSKTNLLLFLFLAFHLLSFAQQNADEINCKSILKGFITEEQDHLINNKDITKINIVFYQGFTYRLAICSEFKESSFEFSLTNEQGNVQYKNIVTRGFVRDFRFESVFRGQIIIKPLKTDNQKPKLLISYKKIEE